VVHTRKKPKARDERLLQDRPDKAFRYSALVWDVLTNRKLEPVDWGVYACLAARAFSSDTFQMGTRWIAGSLGIKKGRTQASIGRLIAQRHVEIVKPSCGSRPPVYRLISTVFAKRQKVILSEKHRNIETTRADIDRKLELSRKLRTG
jgi:hypothetical protein